MKGCAIRPLKILIVDDEYLIRWSLSHALSQEGYEVKAVEDGRKALDAASEHFDFVITDLVMPELDGWQVLEYFRRVHPQTRVIILTAHGKETFEKAAHEKGAWAYIEKPYCIDRIKELLKSSQKDP